jgi:hypothetical protein
MTFHEQERLMRIRTFSAAAGAAGLLAIAAPVAGAGTTPSPEASGPPSPPPLALTFVPPKVGQLSVDIGPTIINGEVIDPGLHVVSPATDLPPMSSTWPPMPASRAPGG